MPLKTIIIDDDPFARTDLANMLQYCKNILVSHESGSVTEAKKVLNQNRFDLAFLDIRLRDGSGFDLLSRFGNSTKVVFTTGYEEYAVKAFEVNAFDYLLKPIARNRLNITLSRLDLDEENSRDLRIKLGRQTVSASRISAATSIGGNYIATYLESNRKLICRATLKSLETCLPGPDFLRIDRSTIINTGRISQIIVNTNNTGRIRLENLKQTFKVSRRMMARLKALQL